MTSKLLPTILALLALASGAGCGNCAPDAPAMGSASIAWSITLDGQSNTCARAGAASVLLTLHNRTTRADVRASFRCTDAEATSPVPSGTYDATLALHAADGAALAAGPTQTPVTIAAGQVTKLAAIAFAVGGRGALSLSLATLATSSNCGAPRDGGAGITGTTLTLVRAGGGCAAVTFTRSRGSTTLGTYTVNCSSPHVAPCIERDETLTVDGVESGPYAIAVGALTGALRCWASSDVGVVPAGASLAKRVQLARAPITGC